MEEKIREMIRSYEIGLYIMSGKKYMEHFSGTHKIILEQKKMYYKLFIEDLKELLGSCKK